MSFDWKSYLTLAQILAEEADKANELLKEALYRTAISRAYYSVFSIARIYLEDVYHLDIPAQKIHDAVIKEYKAGSDIMRDIGDKLHTLRTKRVKADYERIFKGNLARETEGTVALAQEIIILMDKLPHS